MFKKIIGFISAICVIFALTGCSTDTTMSPPEPTATPIAIYNVGERVQADLTGFVIKRGQRFNAAVDKAHIVYGIYVEVRNYDSVDVPFSLTSLTCYAGDEVCPIYEGLEDSLNEDLVPANGTIEGWVYYKIPAVHNGISFTYTYNKHDTYILFVFKED
jgi:hypothetical protein